MTTAQRITKRALASLDHDIANAGLTLKRARAAFERSPNGARLDDLEQAEQRVDELLDEKLELRHR